MKDIRYFDATLTELLLKPCSNVGIREETTHMIANAKTKIAPAHLLILRQFEDSYIRTNYNPT